MSGSDLVMHKEEFNRIVAELQRLREQTVARVVFIVDKNGQLIAAAGETQKMDTTSLASLTAGNIAATGGMAKLLGEKEFTTLFHEGEKENINITLLGSKVILVVIFDSKTSMGLVRLRVKKAAEKLLGLFTDMQERTKQDKLNVAESESPFADISDDDIDALFS